MKSPKDKERVIVEWCVKTESDSITPVLVLRTPWPTAGIILTAPATGNVTDKSVLKNGFMVFRTSFSHPINRLLNFYWTHYKAFWPVIVSIAESSNWDGEWLPYRVQCVLDHLCFVADGEPANKITEIRPLESVAHLFCSDCLDENELALSIVCFPCNAPKCFVFCYIWFICFKCIQGT